MKWEKRGHEFDLVYQNMKDKKEFYLFGAGDYGRQFFKAFREEIKIVGFIDNNIQKQVGG